MIRKVKNDNPEAKFLIFNFGLNFYYVIIDPEVAKEYSINSLPNFRKSNSLILMEKFFTLGNFEIILKLLLVN